MILVIDDQADIAELIAASLGRSGMEVVAETDPRRGRDRAVEGSWRAIVLDLQMPDLDGWTVLGALAGLGDGCPSVVIASVRSDTPSIRRALAAGAVDFVTKPFDLPALAATVEAAAAATTPEARQALREATARRLFGEFLEA